MSTSVGDVRATRKVVVRKEVCSICREVIPKGDCVCIIHGVSGLASHKKCEPEMIAREIERREKTSSRMMKNKLGEKK